MAYGDREYMRLASSKSYYKHQKRRQDDSRERMRKAYAANPEKCIKSTVMARKNNLEKALIRTRKWQSAKLRNDIQYHTRAKLRGRLNKAIKRADNSSTRDLGCTIGELRAWLESQFSPEMNWENYAVVWWLHHKKPLSAFDLTSREQLKKACHYTNIQPMIIRDSIRKGVVRKNRRLPLARMHSPISSPPSPVQGA